MTKSFFNTIGLNGTDLSGATIKALGQEDIIYSLFVKLNIPLTPTDVWQYYKQWPITSIRRAMSVLSKGIDRRLEKTDKMKMGSYGYPEHYWKLTDPA